MMGFKNVKKKADHEGHYIVETGEVPTKEFTIHDLNKDIEEMTGILAQLKKLKKDTEALSASS